MRVQDIAEFFYRALMRLNSNKKKIGIIIFHFYLKLHHVVSGVLLLAIKQYRWSILP